MATNAYPLRHLSIRVPWHDNGWNGTVCRAPTHNGACLKLDRIATSRNDAHEQAVAGQSLEKLGQDQWPCCVAERVSFMAPFEFTRTAQHPYVKSSPETHAHFAPTPLRHPPYSAAAIPFNWMLRESMEDHGRDYNINVRPEWEPALPFHSAWVQDHRNQAALEDCFFGHIVPQSSLCFFYAKQVPLVNEPGRILVGVGRVTHVGTGSEYKYHRKGEIRSMLWERMIQHSIRPECRDGFLLPYHAALAMAEEDPSFDPTDLVAFVPSDHFWEFSFASEHVTHDAAIASLLACAKALENAQKSLEGPWGSCLKWIDARLADLWKMRGPCPGLGAALSAFGVEYGTFVARELELKLEDNEDPWPLVDKMFQNPRKHLSPGCASQVGQELQDTWKRLPGDRRALLKLISRFQVTPDQARSAYVEEEREEAGIDCTDRQLLENPYRLYETTRLTADPVSVWTVDRGVFPDAVVRERHPLPSPTALETGTDPRRVRAILTSILEAEAAHAGHTVVPRSFVITKIRSLDLRPPCQVTGDLMAVVGEHLAPEVKRTSLADESPAYQLVRLAEVGEKIRSVVRKRVQGKRMEVQQDWRSLLDRHLEGTKIEPGEREREERARREKAAALKELAESRISVLIGKAGTGKTTVLAALCTQPRIREGEVLLLAPTGKARVRMEQAVAKKGVKLRGHTLAQFLSWCDRYDGRTGRYKLSKRKSDETAETVIVDEASMLTEEMLAALLDSLSGVKRLILIGDPQQLPPIGAGRPFVDIVSELTPPNLESVFPKVGTGFAQLTVRRRQAGDEREDL
ncbi:MAG: ATP-dependent DNA helicase, partial [Isosphaeraceae bacterium]